MDLFNREELRRLAEQEDEPCISLYMPTQRYESEWTQNTTRFKNLLNDARDQLREQDYREDRVEDILAPARQRLDEPGFWRGMSDGLAVFITSDTTEFLRLPLSFESVAIVGRRFHLKPLFPIIAANNRYYVLSLGPSGVRLYQGTHHALSEVWSTNTPSRVTRSLTQASRTTEGPEDAQPTNGRPADAADAGAEDEILNPAEVLREFLEGVEPQIEEAIGDEKVPLVLAGHPNFLDVYRSVNGYAAVVENDITWNAPEPPSVDDLHEEGWSIVAPVFEDAQQQEVERFEQLYYQNENLASEDFHEIIPASAYGRVDTLFVPIEEYRWGRFFPDTNTVEVRESREPGDGDLFDYAAVRAYLNGSTVHVLQAAHMPGGRSIAATFRYQADVSAAENG
jgi:hypothetical protein